MLNNRIVYKDLKNIPNDSILFVGCSHTFGEGHTDSATTFPVIVSSLQQQQPIVRGNPGQGNHVIEDVLSEYNLQNRSVIVQLTDIFRIRYFDSTSKSVVHKTSKEYTRAEFQLFDELRMSWEFERLVDRIVARLRDANSKFLFFYLTDLTADTHAHISAYKEFCHLLPSILVDKTEDSIHYGVQTHQNIAQTLNQKWNTLYGKEA